MLKDMNCNHRDEDGNLTIEYDSTYEMRSRDMHCKQCGAQGSREDFQENKVPNTEASKPEVESMVELTPQQYFDFVKDRKNQVTDDDLDQVYANCLLLIQKFKRTGQKRAMDKLVFHLQCIEKEHALIKLGIDTFIYRSDVEHYIDKVASDAVKIIELERFEREIPDEILEMVEATKELFSKFYVIFTDYTGKLEKEIEKERRSKDPILFGTFEQSSSGSVVERFYYLGDWEDEFCDLTLDKMVTTMRQDGEKVRHLMKTPVDIEELRGQMNKLQPKDNKNSNSSTATEYSMTTNSFGSTYYPIGGQVTYVMQQPNVTPKKSIFENVVSKLKKQKKTEETNEK